MTGSLTSLVRYIIRYDICSTEVEGKEDLTLITYFSQEHITGIQGLYFKIEVKSKIDGLDV